MIRGIETVEEVHENGFKLPFVVLDLEKAPFSAEEINGCDQLVQQVFKPDRYSSVMYLSKWIVRTDRMYIFQELPHDEADEILVGLGAGDILQSAGASSFFYHSGVAIRTIDGYSGTLAGRTQQPLSWAASDHFKLTFLPPKLGQHFKIK